MQTFDERLRALSEKLHVNIRVRFEGPMCYLDLQDVNTDEQVTFEQGRIGGFGGSSFEKALEEIEAYLTKHPKAKRFPPHVPRDY